MMHEGIHLPNQGLATAASPLHLERARNRGGSSGTQVTALLIRFCSAVRRASASGSPSGVSCGRLVISVVTGRERTSKILHTHLGSGELERFLHEAQLIANLVHPHIVRILDFGVEEGMAFLVMDYAPHGSLAERYPAGQPLPIGKILSPVQQVATALDYAHAAQRLHLDVKPDNLLLGRQQEVWLSDFGIAIAVEDSHHSGEGNITAPPANAAREQVEGHPVLASDQYSLGVVVYEWLTGILPFIGTPLAMATQHVLKTPPPLREHVPTLAPSWKSWFYEPWPKILRNVLRV